MTEKLVVYRFVKHPSIDHPDFVENFLSDAEAGNTPRRDEHPDYFEGMSAYDSLEAAREFWGELRRRLLERSGGKPLKMRLGDHIAEVILEPGQGFEVDAPEDPDPRGHLWVKGDKRKLAEATVDPLYVATNERTT